jgi:FKBP12-rapamycin complex-associated protein
MYFPLQLNQGLIVTHSRKKNAPSEEPIFQCVGMLASAVGPNLTKLLHDQLDLMFACGLSEPLRQALVAIARQIPPLLKTIQGNQYHVFQVTMLKSSRSPAGPPVRNFERAAIQAPWCAVVHWSE